MYLNDMEETFILEGFVGEDIGNYILLYADDIVIFAGSKDGFTEGTRFFLDYCTK